MSYRLGIDVGGTFTDLVLFHEESGTLVVEKVPSVPSDPSEGIMDGIDKILATADAAPSAVAYVAHGTTVATNTLLQRHGARTALITTGGFRDLLEIARQRRPSLYDLHVPKPRVLVRRKLRKEVPERVTADGAVSTIATGYSARAAVGWRALDGFYAGPEIQAFASDGYRQLRFGLHVTSMKTGLFEWTGAAGFARDSDHHTGAYGRLGLLTRR